MNFNEKCYNFLKKVPKGKVVTYSDIAHALDCRAYRAVGNAMGKNPYDTEKVPCHRVVKSNGEIGGYARGSKIKAKRLESEGVKIEKGKVNLKKYKYSLPSKS